MKTAHEAIVAMKAELERLKERAAAERVLHPKTILAAKNYLLIKDYDNLLSFLGTLEAESAPSCRSCGFYENNCPFIRGKFIPYPSKVCKDYTYYSAMKAVEKEVDIVEEYDREYGNDPVFRKLVNRNAGISIARHFRALGKNSK